VRRRVFITLLGGAAAAWPLGADAQQSSRLFRLGFLGQTLNNPAAIEVYEAFRTQLAEFGFREDHNITIDHRVLEDPRGPFVVVAPTR
jgi:putative ABC transport system substrate-binding protein